MNIPLGAVMLPPHSPCLWVVCGGSLNDSYVNWNPCPLVKYLAVNLVICTGSGKVVFFKYS